MSHFTHSHAHSHAGYEPVSKQADHHSYGGIAPPSYTSIRFEPHGCRDVHWAFFFLIHLVAIFGAGIYYAYRYRGTLVSEVESTEASLVISYPLLIVLSSAIVMSLAISFLYFTLMRMYPASLIQFTQCLSIALLALTALSSLLSGHLGSALTAGLILALQVWWFYSVQDRIEFSALLLETAASALRTFYGTFLIAIVGMIAQIVWFAMWLTCASSIYLVLTSDLPRSAYDHYGHYNFTVLGVNIALVLVLLSLYWTSMTISYIVHATIAGVMGVYYFLYPHATPKAPTFASLRRAMTSSLGSLALAALLLAVVKTLRTIVQIVANQRAEEDRRSLLTDIAIGCAQCLLSVLDSLISYINLYSITRIALYGESFYTASDRSLTLLKYRGLDAVINDSLVSTALTVGAVAVAFVTALLTWLMAAIWLPSTETLSAGAVTAFAFMVAFALSSTALQTVEAAVVAFFVCLAEDPHVLYSTKPDVYERVLSSISARYPQCRLDDGSQLESSLEPRHYGSLH